MSNKHLKITGAREHNLKDLDLEIPHDQLCVITGLSGAGKSTLAFDTIHAEGQQRYIETFSTYTRQFFERVKKPDLDLIENVRPSIAIEQKTRIFNSRSTVGSLTDLNDYLALLWSQLAEPACPVCGISLAKKTPKQLLIIINEIIKHKNNYNFLLIASIAINSKKFRAELSRLQQLGYSRLYNPENQQIEKIEFYSASKSNSLQLVLERIRTPGENLTPRIQQAVEQAFNFGRDLLDFVIVESPLNNLPQRRWLTVAQDNSNSKICDATSSRSLLAKPACGRETLPVDKVKSNIFSWSNPVGACTYCKGFGRVLECDPELVTPDLNLSIKDGAIDCWSGPAHAHLQRRLIKFCEQNKISIIESWKNLPANEKDLIFNAKDRSYLGLKFWFKKIEKKSYKVAIRAFLARYRSQFPCPECHTKRLKPIALSYQINRLNITDFMELTITQAQELLQNWQQQFQAGEKLHQTLKEIFNILLTRLAFLQQLGLGYLSINRQAKTLSGGETQRVNLASALGSELVSTQFVLDEPTVGLHPRDTEALLKAIRSLQEKNNTLVVVEHDPDFIRQADQIIELGPEAGAAGGNITYQGTRANWSLENIKPNYQLSTHKVDFSKKLKISNANCRNINNLNLEISCGSFTCLTGVSGSGKSTLIEEIILKNYSAYQQDKKNNSKKLRLAKNGKYNSKIEGFENFEQVLLVDQQAIGKTPRANLATYCGFWEKIRGLLASTEAAKQLGLTKSHFSFNVDGGRCPHCKGAGFIRENMQFLSDVFVSCEHCLGARFLPIVLQIKYQGHSVAEILKTTVTECLTLFADQPHVYNSCLLLSELGLGHLRIGHALSELSGGEAQRLKLIPFLEQTRSKAEKKCLLILDEPTTGLHVRDTEKLITVIHTLQASGNTILCVEHNPLVILSSDWIIDLGPEAGEAGGQIVACDTPKNILKLAKASPKKSLTADYLLSFHLAWSKKLPALKTNIKEIASPKKELQLEIYGARENNLKNFDLKIPYHKTVALTGLSGSGKSTLAKNIIHAEGQRRYLDCLSPYARQFITELKKPDIDQIKNIAPTICVQQHLTGLSRISTIATVSEIYSYLRLLVSKLGQLYCPDHPQAAISAMTASELAKIIKNEFSDNIRILAPVIKSKKGNHKAIFEQLLARELAEVRVDGKIIKASQVNKLDLDRNKTHNIELVIGRFNPQKLDLELIEECLAQAFVLGSGSLLALRDDQENIYSQDRACPICRRGFLKPDPEDLSFSSARGRCPKCHGTGASDNGAKCLSCAGLRISSLARSIKLSGKNIGELCNQPPSELLTFLKNLKVGEHHKKLSDPITAELKNKLQTLIDLGLDQLNLSRDCATLSGGELQRLRLAAALGTPLNSVLYILDEPSANLHPYDHAKVLNKIEVLKNLGNSILLIEHDLDSINSADEILEIGPAAGSKGGEIIFQGKRSDFLTTANSITAQYLNNYLTTGQITLQTKVEKKVRVKEVAKKQVQISILAGRCHNIKDLNLDIPLHQLVVVAGVSGAGKSSLVSGILLQTMAEAPGEKQSWHSSFGKIRSSCAIDKVMAVDQKPIGKNSRSTPASYLGILDHLRKVYASTMEAKTLGYDQSFFSYNSGKGRCLECKGLGEIKLEMSFLPDAHVLCNTCNGQRYRDEILSIRFAGKNFSELLNLTISEAGDLFIHHRQIHEVLMYANQLGLGYLRLGQSSSTLSGGESQRLKLSIELSASKKTHNLYILDEPSIGLHPADLALLINILKTLVNQGHSVLVIEHDLQMLQAADWLIEMGPQAADLGGEVVFEGHYDQLANSQSAWGQYLRLKSKRSKKIAL